MEPRSPIHLQQEDQWSLELQDDDSINTIVDWMISSIQEEEHEEQYMQPIAYNEPIDIKQSP
jgi:hypothetical protein